MRLEITRRADLAVKAMVVLTRERRRWKAPALAEALGTTVGFVPQIVGPLVKAGWVQSEPGPTGGYSALVAPDTVSVLEVIESVDGATEAGHCVVEDRPCNAATPCTLHNAWTRARTELTNVLQQTSIADMAANAER